MKNLFRDEFSVYNISDTSVLEILDRVLKSIKSCVDENEKINNFYNYLINDGLKEEVIEKFNQWYEDGTLNTIINENVFSELNDRIINNEELNNQTRSIIEALKLNNLVNVKDFGAIGDGVTDDTQAINNATMSAHTNGRSGIYFPKGTYKISQSINLRNKDIIGESKHTVVINSHSTNASDCILSLGGVCKVENITVKYDDSVELLASKDKFIAIKTTDNSNERLVKGARISDVNIFNCGTGISDNGVGCFSTTFENIRIKNFTWAGVYFSGRTRTGNLWNNIYIESPDIDCITGFGYEGEESETSINQLNIEHMSGKSSVLYLRNAKAMKISSLHIEGVKVRDNWKGFVDIANTSLKIDSCSFYYTRQENTGCSLFRLGSGLNVVEGQETNVKCNNCSLDIGVLNCKGLARPNRGIYPSYPSDKISLNNSQSFNFIYRDNGFIENNDIYFVNIDEYKWETWSSNDDSNIYEGFKCDPHNDITFIKKGELPKIGTTEQRPTNRLCNGYTSYYDTTLNKMMYYINNTWV